MKEDFDHLRRLIDAELERLLPQSNALYGPAIEAARYALVGGKRLRPIFVLAGMTALGHDYKAGITASCALEFIHAYSLIHDDLPCIDNDDIRRGKPTVHIVYGEGQAVLTGDLLLSLAFEVLASDARLTPEKSLRLVKILAQQSGAEGLVGGQVVDTLFTGKNIDLTTLEKIHRLKTGALFVAALDFACVIADASQDERNALITFAEKIGLAFQVIDDVLDVAGDPEELGKPIGSDIVNNKCTYVTLLTEEAALDFAKKLTDEANAALVSLPGDTSMLRHISDDIVSRCS